MADIYFVYVPISMYYLYICSKSWYVFILQTWGSSPDMWYEAQSVHIAC